MRERVKKHHATGYMAEYRAKNAAALKESWREWRDKNREWRKEYGRAWYAKNSDTRLVYLKAQSHKRRAWKVASGGSFTKGDISHLLKSQKQKCPRCGAGLKKYHIDHIMPLALGGSNDASNIQLLCPPCNLSKGARHPIDDAHRLGRLL